MALSANHFLRTVRIQGAGCSAPGLHATVCATGSQHLTLEDWCDHPLRNSSRCTPPSAASFRLRRRPTPLDLAYMAALARELPLLPVVARADALRPEELAAAAGELAAQMEAYTRGGELGPMCWK